MLSSMNCDSIGGDGFVTIARSLREKATLDLRICPRESPLSAEAVQAWDAFVASQPFCHLFHTQRWQQILTQTFGDRCWNLTATEAGEIKGVLSLQAVRGLTGKLSLYSPSYTAYGGLLAATQDAAQLLADGALSLCRETGAGMVQLRNFAPNDLALPTTDLHVSFVKDLEKDEQACLEAIPRKSRWTVRQGITKHKLEWEVNRDVDLM